MNTKALPEQYIIYGAMGLGGPWEETFDLTEEHLSRRKAIETALEEGITFFDLADIYKNGRSEIVFGEYLKKASGDSGKYYFAVKSRHTYLGF